MKRFFKVFSLIILCVGAFFLFSSEARANFAESFTEVVDSLRGVEEEAVKIFMPQPQSVDEIVLEIENLKHLPQKEFCLSQAYLQYLILETVTIIQLGLKTKTMELIS